MSDLISREALIEKLEEHIEYADYDYYHEEPFINLSWEMVENIVGTVPTVPQWIPCSERLPEEDKMSDYYESVIVTLDNGRVVNGCYRNIDEEWWVDAEDGEKYSINVTGHVIAWIPLPPSYKGE